MTAPFRVLPVLDDANRGFWTSGADGRLRFSRCQGCGYWLHPPTPRCPECGGRDVAWEPVSGRGEVFSYTVNHQPWDGTPEPWAIVLVAFPEQEGLRLTSNLDGIDPDDVRIGLPVEVRFEEHGEVWFPVFVPADHGDEDDPDRRPGPQVRGGGAPAAPGAGELSGDADGGTGETGGTGA